MKWIEKRLDDLGFVARGRSKNRPRDAPHLYGGPYPFIQTGDVKHANFFIRKYSQTYSEAGLEQSKIWPAGTLCITIAANIAETAILDFDACFPDSVVGFIADDKKTDVRFVKYLFDIVKKQYQQISQGAAQDNLSLEKLYSLKFRVPEDPKDHHRIANFLACYDNLIENNLRRMELLEQTSRLLYQEWFMKLRFPGYEHTKIIDSVPEKWERKKLSDIVVLNYGKALKEDDRCHGLVPVYGSSGIIGHHDKHLVKGPGIIVGRKGNVGSVFFTTSDYWPIDTVYFIKSDQFSFFNYHTLLGQSFINSDTAIPGLNREWAYRLPIIYPEKRFRDEFERFVTPLYALSDHLRIQNERLCKARDLLLPKLVKREIAI